MAAFAFIITGDAGQIDPITRVRFAKRPAIGCCAERPRTSGPIAINVAYCAWLTVSTTTMAAEYSPFCGLRASKRWTLVADGSTTLM